MSWKDRKPSSPAAEHLPAADAEAGRKALEAFEGSWGRKYPAIAQIWRRQWEQVIPFFAFARTSADHLHHECRRNRDAKLRHAVRSRGRFPSDDAR